MAHPSQSLPTDIYILTNNNTLSSTSGSRFVAVYNPTAAAITVTVKGAVKEYDATSDKYISSASKAIAVPAGATIYGNFTEFSGTEMAGLFVYA